MSNEALLWNAPAPPPKKRPLAEHVWTVRKGLHRLDCGLISQGQWGVECQFFDDRRFIYGRRWPKRELALMEATDRLQELLRQGYEQVEKSATTG
jgi:hypothetical protein